MRKICLLYVQDSFTDGGISAITSTKENYFVNKEGYEVHNLNALSTGLNLPEGTLDEKVIRHDIYINTLNKLGKVPLIGRLLRFVYYRVKLLKIIFSIKPDVIILTHPKLEPLTVLLLSFWKKRVLEFHGWFNITQPDSICIRERLDFIFMYHFYNLVALTQGEALHLQKLTKNKSIFIPNPLERLPEIISNCESKRVVLFARFSKEKGIVPFLPFWKKIQEQYPEWELCLFGRGVEEDKIRQTIENHNLHTVKVYPYTNQVDVELSKSSICILTSYFEGWGLVLTESMAVGVPCIAYDCPFGPSEIIHDSEDGFLTEYLNPDAMVDKIKFLIENPDRRKAMGGKARINVQRFNIDQIMGQWMHLFENLMYGKFLQPPTI